MKLLPDITCEWTMDASGSSDQIAESLAACLIAGVGARPEPVEGDWKVYEIGSRAGFRTWGLLGRKGYRRLPIRVRTRQFSTDDGSTRVQVELRNDEGPYVTRLPSVHVAYQRAFTEIRHAILGALGDGR
jgi:hypothetical protein